MPGVFYISFKKKKKSKQEIKTQPFTAFYIQTGRLKPLHWRVCCLNNPQYVFFLLLFSIQPLPVSVSDCRSECVWEGESKFFHGSSQPLAHSAAKWVTVYPLPQLRVLMCESVYVENVWMCLCVDVSVRNISQGLVRGLSRSVAPSLSASPCHTHSSIIIIMHKKTQQHRGSLPSMEGCFERENHSKWVGVILWCREVR